MRARVTLTRCADVNSRIILPCIAIDDALRQHIQPHEFDASPVHEFTYAIAVPTPAHPQISKLSLPLNCTTPLTGINRISPDSSRGILKNG